MPSSAQVIKRCRVIVRDEGRDTVGGTHPDVDRPSPTHQWYRHRFQVVKGSGAVSTEEPKRAKRQPPARSSCGMGGIYVPGAPTQFAAAEACDRLASGGSCSEGGVTAEPAPPEGARAAGGSRKPAGASRSPVKETVVQNRMGVTHRRQSTHIVED